MPSACTSLLVRREDGSVMHGRSLDYEPRDAIAAGTVVIDFHRGGKPAYRCLHPLIYPTATQWFTCVRPGAFSLSVNARSQGMWNDHWVPLESGAYATVRRQHAVELISGYGPSLTKDQLLQVYFTQQARAGGESRVEPEDTGVILRPTTIATLIMDPAAQWEQAPDPRYWHIWAETPVIHPPAYFEVVAMI